MINETDTPIKFYRVKAHIGVIGNESAGAMAKHAAPHKYGHDQALTPPSPDGTPFSHTYWLAERTMRLLALPLESASHHYKILRTN